MRISTFLDQVKGTEPDSYEAHRGRILNRLLAFLIVVTMSLSPLSLVLDEGWLFGLMVLGGSFVYLLGILLCRQGHIASAVLLVGLSLSTLLSIACILLPHIRFATAPGLVLGLIVISMSPRPNVIWTGLVLSLPMFYIGYLDFLHSEYGWAASVLALVAICSTGIILWFISTINATAVHREVEARGKLAVALEEQRQARKLAEAASAAKSRFLANMSHELRTPLNAVIGYSELLMEEVEEGMVLDAESAGAELENIQTAGKHLLSVVSDVLDLTCIESGEIEIEARRFLIEPMVEGMLDIVRPQAARQGNALGFELRTERAEFIGDRSKMIQILLNLLSNACKFTQDGDVELRVEDGLSPGELVFVVRDTGVGMREEDRARVFEAFSQVDESSTRAAGGLGVGLALVREMVDILDGELRLESEVGEGTTFWVTFPPLRLGQDANLKLVG